MPENVREIVDGPNIMELFTAMTKPTKAHEVYFVEKKAYHIEQQTGQNIVITSIERFGDSGNRFIILGWIGYPRQDVKVVYDTNTRTGHWKPV
jgi:hypothetical protein